MEIKFFRRAAGRPFFNHKRNETILEELNVEPVDEILRRQQITLATNSNRMTKITLNYIPNERR
jgi:hypothetical protein